MSVPIGLLFAMLAFGQSGSVIFAESDSSLRYIGTPSMTLTAANVGSCELDELFSASLAMMEFNPDQSKAQSQPAIYFTPAQQLRNEAALIERRDAAVTKWRDVIGRCSAVYETIKQTWKATP